MFYMISPSLPIGQSYNPSFSKLFFNKQGTKDTHNKHQPTRWMSIEELHRRCEERHCIIDINDNDDSFEKFWIDIWIVSTVVLLCVESVQSQEAFKDENKCWHWQRTRESRCNRLGSAAAAATTAIIVVVQQREKIWYQFYWFPIRELRDIELPVWNWSISYWKKSTSASWRCWTTKSDVLPLSAMFLFA